MCPLHWWRCARAIVFWEGLRTRERQAALVARGAGDVRSDRVAVQKPSLPNEEFMRYLNGFLCLLLALFTIVQYNDPDAVLWVPSLRLPYHLARGCRVPSNVFAHNQLFLGLFGLNWSCPRQTGQVAGWCALMNWRGERIPRARCGCISL
jgi:hypothetical protein